MLELLEFDENPNVGVFCKTNEDIVFIRKGLSKKIKTAITNALDVKIVEITIADATIIGSLLAINSNGAISTDFIDYKTIKTIKDQNLNFCMLEDRFNAAGNDILVNDHGALVHPEIKDKSIKILEEIFNVPVYKGTIATLNTVGMAAVVTNKGCLCHPKVTLEEKKLLEEIFKVEVMIGTVNHGIPLIGSGLVANSKGAIIGSLTTGIEMGRIEESLGFL